MLGQIVTDDVKARYQVRACVACTSLIANDRRYGRKASTGNAKLCEVCEARTPPPHGLIFDGDVRGRYTGEAVQDMATGYGWTGEELSADKEFYDEAITEAEDWLNANIAKDGSVFSFDYGSFYYQPLDWYEDI